MPCDLLQRGADPLVLYTLRFRAPVSGKWVRPRCQAERHEIAARHSEWEIVAPPGLRRPLGVAFSPSK